MVYNELIQHDNHLNVKRKARILLLPQLMANGRPSASGYVRLIDPYTNVNLDNYRINWSNSKDLPVPGIADVIFIQRDMPGINLDEITKWMGTWKEVGGKIIYEIDDNLMDREGIKLRTHRTDLQTQVLVDRVKTFATMADLVTVSMPALLKVMEPYCSSIKLVPNFLDENKWWLNKKRSTSLDIFVKKESDPIRIGYIGTPTHDQDLEIVTEAILMLEKEFGKAIEVEVIGAFDRIKPMFGRKVNLPEVTEYPDFVEWLGKTVHWDIGIIPLKNDNFNKSKSFLKFLEYSALNLAIVCSDLETYSYVARHGENCLVASNDKTAWYQAIKKLIEDSVLRNALAERAHAELLANYTIQANSSLYNETLNCVIAGRNQERKEADFFLFKDDESKNKRPMRIKKCVIVLGMHRSGTSALTGLLVNLGFSAGKKMLPLAQDNSKGHFECLDIVTVHDQLLKELGSFWHDVRFLPKEWVSSEVAKKSKSKLKLLFEKEYAGDDYCVFKDPRLCILLPLWLEIFQELEIKPVFIITTRLPNEVTASLAKRNKMATSNANLLYVKHLINAERCTRDYKRVIISFSDLLTDWRSVLQRIDERLALNFLPVSKDTALKVENFLAPDLKHFAMEASVIACEIDFSSQLANDLYKQLFTLQAHDFQELNKLYTSFSKYLSTLEPWLSHSAKIILSQIDSVAFSKIYWQTTSDSDYNELQFLDHRFFLNQITQLLTFTFPEVNGAMSRLRFDISNRPGCFVLQDIKLIDATGKVLWVWDKASDIFEKLSQDIQLFPLIAEQQLIIMVTGADPQVSLQLPLVIFPKISKGCKLEVQLTAQAPIAGIKNIIDRYDQLLIMQANLMEQITSLTTDVFTSVEKNKALATENDLLSRQNQECHEEIIRAQSQLELLKDLMLGTSVLERF